MLFSRVQWQDLIVALIIVSGVALSIVFRKLTIQAACVGGLLAACLYIAFGPVSITTLAVFFVSATVATRAGMTVKVQMGFAEKNRGRRTTGQVLANGGAAGILGVMAILLPAHTDTLRVMAAAAFASATSDTLSSELGNVYGTRFYNIVTFKKGERGADGVISAEGCLWGIAGSAIISGVHGLAFGFQPDVVVIFVAGIIGNVADSLLGALFETRNRLTNNEVNALNTIVAALVAMFGVWLTS